jgi:hypothetical protein
MVIRFPDARHTYDLRNRKYLGNVDNAPLPLRKSEAALFARLPYKVTGLEVNVENAERGKTVSISVKVTADGKPERHVVHVEVYEPEGERNYFYTKNVNVVNGEGKLVIHTALNDPAGKWTVNAREVVSGIEKQTTFELR